MARSLRFHLRDAANRLLRPVGVQLVRRSRAFDMDGLLARAAGRGHPIATWLDVGASDGSWSLLARRHFPHASFLLFEPLAERRSALAALERRHGFAIVAAAAGRVRGTAELSVDPNLDGSSMAEPGATGARFVPVETIASAVAERNLPAPYAIKLDTHGFEIPILEGAGPVLVATELLIIEAYNFRLTRTSLRFHELCAWLELRGFRCCDLADPMRRPSDGVFWQADFAFARADHPIFADHGYL